MDVFRKTENKFLFIFNLYVFKLVFVKKRKIPTTINLGVICSVFPTIEKIEKLDKCLFIVYQSVGAIIFSKVQALARGNLCTFIK